MRFFAIFLAFALNLWAHGLFYSANEGKAIIINANFSKQVSAAYAKIEIYKGDSAIPVVSSKMDSFGRFAFVPNEKGNYRVQIIASSDHGEHKVEFGLDADADLNLGEFEKQNYQKYFSILSGFGILFGIFGILAMFKRRKA